MILIIISCILTYYIFLLDNNFKINFEYLGITVGADGKIFVADGTNIRQVDENGIITTLIGHQRHRSTWRPMPCGGSNGGGGSMPINEVQLNWPTELAISPLDGSLHIVDDGVVLKVLCFHSYLIILHSCIS